MEIFWLVLLPGYDSENFDFATQGPFSSNVLLIEAVNSRRRVASHPRGVVLYYPLGEVRIEWWGVSEADEVIYTLN